jgi:hypothetical protein
MSGAIDFDGINAAALSNGRSFLENLQTGAAMTPALLKRTACQLEILALSSLELADRVAAGEIAFLDAVDVAARRPT